MRKQKSRHTIYSNSTRPPFLHPYLAKKRIKPHGVKLYKDCLLIPLHNEQRQLVNLQFISANGEKKFLTGGRKKGCFYWIGHPKAAARTVLIAEGFATAASLQEATGHSMVVAFDAGNLKPVAEIIKRLAPCAEIIICADQDLSGIGETKAREAALAVNGKYILPPTLGDFNDHLSGSAQDGS